MSAVLPIDLPVDEQTKRRLRRGERRLENETSGRVKNRLTSPWATLAALIIAVIWTVPTLGLLITSFRDPALTARVAADLEADLKQCKEITLEMWRGRPVWEKLIGTVAWILERQQ